MEKDKKIVQIKQKMAVLSPSSMAYQTYSEVLKTLSPIQIHTDPGDNLCDGCQ